jgi:ankyrin repeat protein
MNKLIVLASLLISAQPSLADINSEIVNAATDGQTETLKTLISGSADVQSDSRLALISAAFSALERQGNGESYDGQVEAVQILTNAGAAVDEHFDNGMTALMLMAILGQTDVVRVLLDAGADVNAVATSADGSTPLIFAVFGGVTEVVSMLIEAGADVDLADAGTGSGDGRTALSYAEEKDHAEIVGVLKQAGAK